MILNDGQSLYAALDLVFFVIRSGGDSGTAKRAVAGSLCTADYGVNLHLFSGSEQCREFASSFAMHSVVRRFCPFYSLGQSMGTKAFRFIDALHRTLNQRATSLFTAHRTPQSVYKPAVTANADELFAAAIAAAFYKLFGREMAAENVRCFESGRVSLAVIGAFPPLFLDFFGDFFPSKYWAMASLWRSFILEDEAVRGIVVRLAAEHGLDQSARALDHCVNSLAAEVLPGCAGIAAAVAVGLEQFNSAQGEQQRAAFRANPEHFAVECIRMDGTPYSARTVLSEWTQIEVEGTDHALHRGNCILSDMATIGRCPLRFGPNPNEFDSKRGNLTADPVLFGSTEQLIRSGEAVKQCPLHDFSIMMVQEMLARIAGIQCDVMYNGQRFEKSYQ